MLTQELISYFFDGQPHLLSQPMGIWLESRRFAVFATTFRDKIRKKLRVTQDQESLLDLRLELVTAYLLLQERSLNLVYEPQLAERTRSPDFAVSYTTSFTFMLEVTRLRAEVREQDLSTSTAQTHPLTPLIDERLTDTICSKLGQLLPQHSNVLLVGVEALRLTQSDLRATLLRIQQRAEQNDAIFLQKHRFRDRTHFFQHYLRLSEVLVRRHNRQQASQSSPGSIHRPSIRCQSKCGRPCIAARLYNSVSTGCSEAMQSDTVHIF